MSSKNNIFAIGSSLEVAYKVSFASVQDIKEIMAICEEQLINNRKEEDVKNVEQSGFLVGQYEESRWQEIIKDEEYSLTLTCKRNNEIVGYITGFDLVKTENEFRDKALSLLAIKNIEGAVFYYNQIAKKRNVKNVGKALVRSMIDEVKKRKFQFIVCKIIHEPIKNKASIAFHEKLGFKFIGEIYQENYLRGIYLRTIS